MIIRFGYVGVPVTFDDMTYNHTLTFTQYSKMTEESRKEKLDFIIKTNLNNLKKVLKYNIQNDIHFYRISHNFIPLATHANVKFDYITPYLSDFIEIGNFIKNNNMRVDTHPDQYCVLNSTNETVIQNSIQLLEFVSQIYNAFGIHGKAILHIGGGVLDKTAGKERFIKTFLSLPKHLQEMILLENDDVVYTAMDILEVCEKLNIPMVLDYHHYLIHHEKEKIEDLVPRIIATWNETSLHPKMHYSNSKNSKEKRSHSEYINYREFEKFLSLLKKYQTNIDIMLECKKKDEALFRLVREIKFKTNYPFLNLSTIYIN